MKRRTMSRLAALLLAAGLSLALFGCTPKTDDSQPASDPAASTDTQTPEASSDDTAQEPAAPSDSQPAAKEDEAVPTDEEKQAVTEKVEEQLAQIQEQSEQLEADSTTEGDSEVQAELNEAADALDAYLKEEVEGSSN